jgi:hypothetical protein
MADLKHGGKYYIPNLGRIGVSGQLHAPAALPSGKGPQAFIKHAGSGPETRGCSEKFTNDTLYRLYATRVGLLTAADPRSVHGLQWTILVPATVFSGQ